MGKDAVTVKFYVDIVDGVATYSAQIVGQDNRLLPRADGTTLFECAETGIRIRKVSMPAFYRETKSFYIRGNSASSDDVRFVVPEDMVEGLIKTIIAFNKHCAALALSSKTPDTQRKCDLKAEATDVIVTIIE